MAGVVRCWVQVSTPGKRGEWGFGGVGKGFGGVWGRMMSRHPVPRGARCGRG